MFRRLSKNKKGHIFMVILLVLTLIAFSSIVLVINDVIGDSRTIGQSTTSLIEATQEGENVLNYIDFAAKFAVRQSEYELALKGGMLNSECGDYKGVNLWYSDGKLCLPKNYKEDYKSIFINHFEEQLKGEFDLNKDNFKVKILSKKVIGLADKDISIVGGLVDTPKVSEYKALQTTPKVSLDGEETTLGDLSSKSVAELIEKLSRSNSRKDYQFIVLHDGGGGNRKNQELYLKRFRISYRSFRHS